MANALPRAGDAAQCERSGFACVKPWSQYPALQNPKLKQSAKNPCPLGCEEHIERLLRRLKSVNKNRISDMSDVLIEAFIDIPSLYKIHI